MSEQIIKYNSRVIQKHDTSDNWSKATTFVPLSGEIIVYDDLRKIKIGDGGTTVSDLPFSSSTLDELVAGDKIDITIDSDNNSATVSHEALPEDSPTTLSATAEGTDSATWDETSLVTGVEITRDNYGHITDVAVSSIKMPANPDTNTVYTAGDGIAISGDENEISVKTAYETNEQNYAVQTDDDGNLYVNVPWENNTYEIMKGASSSADGAPGLVPKPTKGNQAKFLRADGAWATPPDENTTYDVVSTTANGLAPKLPGGTTKYLRADGAWATPPNTTYKAGNGLKLTDTTFNVLYGDGLTLDDNKNLKLDSSYVVTQQNYGASGRTGLMKPQDKWDLEYVKMILDGLTASTTSMKGLPVGLYKFGTTSYGLAYNISPVTAEDLNGMEINTESSGASNTSSKIFLIGAKEQATTAKTFTNSKAYIDASGYLYSNSKKVLNSDSAISNSQLTGLIGTDGKILTAVLPSSIDEIIEGNYYADTDKFIKYGDGSTAITPVIGKLYVDMSTSKVYHWTGSTYTEVLMGNIKGVPNGVASLDANGKIPATQLPSYVDDIIEGNYYADTDKFIKYGDGSTAITPETGKIYVDISTRKIYRWSGSTYTEISASLALGNSENSAFRGDLGQIAYDHSQETGNPHGLTLTDLGLGLASSTANGLMSKSQYTKLDGIATGAEVNQNAFAKFTIGDKTITADAKQDTLTFVAGANISLTPDTTNDKITIDATNSVYYAGTGLTLDSATFKVNTGYTENGKNYAVKADDNGKLYVSVPWVDTDTKYTLPNATTSAKGGVIIGDNINVSNGKISLTKDNVTTALGFTPISTDSDTANTAGSHQVTSKLYLVGTLYQGPYYESYSNDKCYAQDGHLYSNGTKVLTAHQSLANYSTLADTIKSLSISGKTITYTKGDGSTGTLTTQDTNTTYSAMTAATSSAAGKTGLVPAPGAGKHTSFLRGDGTWVVPTNTTYYAHSGGGLILDGGGFKVNTDYTSSGKNYKVQIDSTSGGLFVNVPWTDNNTTYSNFVKSGSGAKAGLVPAPSTTAGTTKYLREDGTWAVPPDTNTTYGAMTGASSSADGAAGLVPKPTKGNQSKFLRADGTWATPTDTNTTYYAHTGGGLTLERGGFKVNTGYTSSGKNYKVQVDSTSGGLFVNVPWTDTNTDTNTCNTAGSHEKSDKLFLVGCLSQGPYYETFSNSKCYASGGYLYSNNTKVSVEGHTHSYAAASHNHAASNITSGTLNIARIPTGTTSTTVALGNHNHDGTYATSGHNHDGTYATSGHTHDITLASSTGTSSITLAHGSKYQLTAGGKSIIFTMPSDNNTKYSAGTGLSLSSNSFSVKYGTAAGTACQGNDSRLSDARTPTAHTHAASEITSGLATVATSGSYNDLSNKPSIPSGAAASKGVDTSISAASTSTNLPTSKAVAAFVEGKGYKTTDNNTTYTIATGDSNGQIKVTPSSGSAYNVNVKGLGTSAYYSYGTFALASHGTHVSAATVKSALGTGTGTTKYLREDGTWATPPDTDTKYTLPNATSSTLGGVKVGTNITVSSGTISLTKANVTNALGYTPPTSDTNTTYSAGTGISLSGTTFSLNTGYYATTTTSGLMSAADKAKLDGIASGANNYTYTLPSATSSTLGGVKVGTNITVSSGTISLTKANVTNALGYTPPTTNTTYSVANRSTNGLMSAGYYAHLIDHGHSGYMSTGGGSFTGAINVNSKASMDTLGYVTGTWLRTTNASDLGAAAAQIAVISDGWIYYRSPAELRSDIGAGTSNLAIGTTSTTAAAGNHTHSTLGSLSTSTLTVNSSSGSMFTVKYSGSNKFRVDSAGWTYAARYYTGGADYSELMEWIDKNARKEDRRGYFVAIAQDETIKIANSEDDVIGVVSATPSVVGNDAPFEWHKKYLTDVYGNYIMEEVFYPETTDENGEIIPAHTMMEPKLNPEYDPNMEYVPRNARPEWAAIGMLGQLIVRDDGTCQPGKYCKCNDNGIATISDGREGWRVIKRLDNHHVKILFK